MRTLPEYLESPKIHRSAQRVNYANGLVANGWDVRLPDDGLYSDGGARRGHRDLARLTSPDRPSISRPSSISEVEAFTRTSHASRSISFRRWSASSPKRRLAEVARSRCAQPLYRLLVDMPPAALLPDPPSQPLGALPP